MQRPASSIKQQQQQQQQQQATNAQSSSTSPDSMQLQQQRQHQQEQQQGRLRIMTYNCWGLLLVAKLRQERLKAISKYINEYTEYDAICLQEVWCASDWDFMRKMCKAKMPYGHYFKSAVIGSGCAILSKHPIVEAIQKPYSLNGRPQNLFHGDWLAGKSAGLCRLQTSYGIVDLYTTHLIAQYTPDKTKDDSYAPHRLCQILEYMAFIRHTSRHHTIVTGDFNLNSFMPGMHLFTSPLSGLVDCWASVSSSAEQKVRTRTRLAAETPRQSQLVIEDIVNGVTCDTRSNTFSQHMHKMGMEHETGRSASFTDLAPNSVEKVVSCLTKGLTQKSQRIDYIFYLRTGTLECISSQVVMTKPIPRLDCSYSDHYGVEAEFSIQPIDSGSQYISFDEHISRPDSPTSRSSVITSALECLDRGIAHSSRARSAHLFRWILWSVVWLLCLILQYVPLRTMVWPYHLVEILTGTMFWYECLQVVFVIRMERVALQSCKDEFYMFLDGVGKGKAQMMAASPYSQDESNSDVRLISLDRDSK